MSLQTPNCVQHLNQLHISAYQNCIECCVELSKSHTLTRAPIYKQNCREHILPPVLFLSSVFPFFLSPFSTLANSIHQPIAEQRQVH